MPARSTVRRPRRVLLGLLAGVLLVTVVPAASGAPVAGSAGTDTSLPATDSRVEVSGRGPFSDLKVTVNQTKNLVNQAVSITWTGGRPTTSRARFESNYLQIMQCWGDDDGSVPSNPGPSPEQCEFGAVVGAVPGGGNDLFPPAGRTGERVVSIRGWTNTDPDDGFLESGQGLLWKPFRAVDGTVINVGTNPDFDISAGSDYWLNTYFNQITSNEIVAARTGSGGDGAELFEMLTGVESSGLGCGQAVEPVADGSKRVPKCWLVVVPRGTADEEDVGTPSHGRAGSVVVTSPLSRRSWANRIAIPMEFNPVDSPCSLGEDLRRIAGTELALPAVVSWQPALCGLPGLPPYSYSLVSDASARQQLLRGTPGAPGLVLVSRPIDKAQLDPAKPVVYAPISLSALVIGFNIERIPDPNPAAPIPEEEELRGVRVAELNLTPRLVAKLLTQSYSLQVAIGGPPPYDWAADNPKHLAVDPDFLQFNPEFELLDNNGKNLGGLVMSGLNSDAAHQVWEWVLSDPEARAWLDGAPDPFGMKVNPVYATTAEANSAGAAFGDPIPSTYPKSDPYCFTAPPYKSSTSEEIVPSQLCGGDWLPYALGMREAARATRTADDSAKTTLTIDAKSSSQAYRRDGPQRIGSRSILSITDSASAFQYGIQMARLSRAGDNGPNRAFIAPDAAGLSAGVEAMAAKDEPTVLEPVPNVSAPAAYPLTALTYGAMAPLALDAKAREEYAAFVEYAAGPGQVPGLELGQLPRGFVELPEPLRAQAAAAAKKIRELKPDAAAPAGAAAAGAAATVRTPSGSGGQAASAPAASPSPSGSPTVARPQPASTSEGSPAAPAALTVTELTTPALLAAPLVRALTPVLALAATRFVLPGLVGVLLFSALGALEITKRGRYVSGSAATQYASTTRAARRRRKGS